MVQIITDSSTLYTMEEAKKAGFLAIPLCVSIGDTNGRDLLMDMDHFYGEIAKGLHPQSSQPPVGEVIEVFEQYKNEDVINISMADGLSGTYQSACGAKESVEGNEKITVINSKTLCGPHKYMVERAQELVNEGKTKEEVLQWIEYAIDHQESFLIPQDFDFLRRGGRLTPLAATIGSILKFKPIMTQTPDGRQLEKFGIKRTMSAAFEEVIKHFVNVRKLDERHIIYISHARDEKDAMKAKEMIKNSLPQCEVRMLELSPAFVTQGGPQCVAIQWIEK